MRIQKVHFQLDGCLKPLLSSSGLLQPYNTSSIWHKKKSSKRKKRKLKKCDPIQHDSTKTDHMESSKTPSTFEFLTDQGRPWHKSMQQLTSAAPLPDLFSAQDHEIDASGSLLLLLPISPVLWHSPFHSLAVPWPAHSAAHRRSMSNVEVQGSLWDLHQPIVAPLLATTVRHQHCRQTSNYERLPINRQRCVQTYSSLSCFLFALV